MKSKTKAARQRAHQKRIRQEHNDSMAARKAYQTGPVATLLLLSSTDLGERRRKWIGDYIDDRYRDG